MKPTSRKEAALWLRRWNLLCGRDWFWEFLSGKIIAELILQLLLFVGNEWRSCLLSIDCKTRERERVCVCVVCDEEAWDWVRLRNTSWILQPATAAGNGNHHRAELTNESCGVMMMMMMMMMQAFFGICCQRVGKVVSGLNSCVALPADLVLSFYQCRGGGGAAAAAAAALTRVSGNRQCTAAGKRGGGKRNKREWDQREEEHQQLQQQQQQVEQEEVWSNSTLQASRSFMA